MTGDAATNAACGLASVSEISAYVGAGVTEIKGLTQPGAYAPTMLSCTWYVDLPEIGSPNVSVQWEFPVTSFHDAVLDLYASIVSQDLATEVPGVGEYAIAQSTTVEAIDAGRIVRVTALAHLDQATGQVIATDLLRLMFPRSAELPAP